MTTASATERTTSKDFMTYWSALNMALDKAGHPEVLYGDARYWFGRKFLPETAAELIIEEREVM